MAQSNDSETRTIPMSEARKQLTNLPEQLAEQRQVVAVTRHGKPVLAVMTWELYEAIEETLEIMSNPELMAALKESIQEADDGKLIPLADVTAELGLDDSE